MLAKRILGTALHIRLTQSFMFFICVDT